MDVKLNFTNVDGVIFQLRNIAEKVSDKARKTMHRGADKIVSEAQLNTPVDTHDLEQSIHKEASYGDRGRLRVDVVAGRGLNYANEVHENYEGLVAPNGPGPGTLEKMAANPGRYIGSKFLERAVDAQRDKLRRDVIEATREVINET